MQGVFSSEFLARFNLLGNESHLCLCGHLVENANHISFECRSFSHARSIFSQDSLRIMNWAEVLKTPSALGNILQMGKGSWSQVGRRGS